MRYWKDDSEARVEMQELFDEKLMEGSDVVMDVRMQEDLEGAKDDVLGNDVDKRKL